MNKFKKPLLILSSLFLGFIGLWFYIFRTIQPPLSENTTIEVTTPSETSRNVSITINYEDENTISYKRRINEGEVLTVFDLLLEETSEKNEIELVTEQYDFGIFVKSIGGYENSSEKAWIYFVNGESGQVGADAYELKPGDVVEWRYVKPEF